MPKTIVTRSATGLDCAPRRLRSGHYTKSIDKCCCCCPENIDEQVTLFTEQMNQITANFFEPFFESPMEVDLKKSYCDINAFFEEQRAIYANRPEVLTQIEFITNAMTLVRTDASQYFLKSLQYESLAREIETSIQGLLMHIYMLNTRIAILSGYTGEEAVGGQTSIDVKQIQDPRYAVAKWQPKLSMLSFLYPDQPTGKYYTKLKVLLSMSGMYENECDITTDMVNFLDRYIIKYDLNKTLEQWLLEQTINNDTIEDYTDIITNDENHMELLRQWKEIHGDTVLDGKLTIDVHNIDAYLSNVYRGNMAYLRQRYPEAAQCPPPSGAGGIHPWQSPLGKMIPLSGVFSMNPANSYNFNTDDLTSLTGSVEVAKRTLEKLYAPNPTITKIKQHTFEYVPPTFTKTSTTRKKCVKVKNNCTRKNICS